MKKLITILFLFSFAVSFSQRLRINTTGYVNATINKAGESHTVQISEVFAPAMFPIEYKADGADYASAIVIRPEGGTVDYDYLDYASNIIATSSISMNTRRPLQLIKNDVFSSLTLTDLQTMTFAGSAENTLYIAFGNLLNAGWPNFPWGGRHGTTHIANGEKALLPYSSLTRTFGSRVLTTARSDPQDVRGGSHIIIDDTIYNFTALYTEVVDSFTCLVLSKSTDLTGTSYLADDTLLYYPNQHGGVNEAKYKRFNFYGTPFKVGNTWFVFWYEHQNAVTWRVNYIKSDDKFQTFTMHNVSESSTFQIGETSAAHMGGDTILLMGRFDGFVPLYQNVSFDLGATWEGWERTNMGSSDGRAMASILKTDDGKVVCVYGDRDTRNIMLSKGNNLNDVLAFPLTWNSPQIIFTTTATDSFDPLGYPSIIRVAQGRYMISFSEEVNAAKALLYIGDGALP